VIGGAVPELLKRPRVVIALTLGLLFAGLLVDMTTPQELVVAIIFNIPIAVSGLANSRRLTAWTIVLALAANVAAAYENALVFSGYDEVTLINRGLAALSFLIVGGMTLLREGAVDEVEHLVEVRQEAERERALRRFTAGLNASLRPDDLVGQATVALRQLLDADGLVVATLRDERFTEPRWEDGHAGDLATAGELASWAVDAIPTTEVPAITVRSERGLITTGRWHRPDGDDLIVVADRPRAAKPSVLLGEALHGLVPLLDQAGGAGGSASGGGPSEPATSA
jgi:hypothetical protein